MKTIFSFSGHDRRPAAGLMQQQRGSIQRKEHGEEQPVSQLNILPTVGAETRAGFISKTDWAAGDAIGLFMYKATGWGDAYPRYSAQNNKSTRQANSWTQASPVYLLSDKATIWAYYPYNQSVTDGTRIPVPVNAGTPIDYMWGKAPTRFPLWRQTPGYR